MSEERTNLIDMLDHSPDIMADAKVKVMMSDIYDEMVSYVNDDNAKKVAGLISNYGTQVFIEWFIDNVYLPKTADVKVMAYVAVHKNDICDILGQAMSNLTAKEVMDNAEDDKQDDENPEEGTGGEEKGDDGQGKEEDEGNGEPPKSDGEGSERNGGGDESETEEGGRGPADEEPPVNDGGTKPEKQERTYDDELVKASMFVDELMSNARGE